MKRALALAVLSSACVTTRGQPVSAPGELAYMLRHPAPRDVDVELRRVREGPAAFVFSTPGAVERVEVTLKNADVVLVDVPSSGEVDLPNDWAAVRYRFPLDDVIRANGPTDLGWGVAAGNDFLVPGAALFLKPRAPHEHLSVTIEDAAPEGMEVSLPWSGFFSWKLTAKELAEPGFYAAGGRRRFVAVGDANVELAILGPQHPLGDDRIIGWLQGAAREVLTVRSRFPAERVLLAAIPVLSNEASPFARTQASQPRSIGFLIGTEATSEDFFNDWVGVHELLRLAIPTFEPRELWLSEGLLAYFTQAAGARSGRQKAERAWEELLDVLDHGADEAGGMRMEEVIRDSGAGGRLRAVTAVGLLFVLALDAQLRAATGGFKHLNHVLDAVRPGPITLADFREYVDAAAGKRIFDALFNAHRVKQALMPRHDLIDAFGVVRRNAKVTFAAPDPIRDAMMR